MVMEFEKKKEIKQIVGNELHIRFYPKPQIINADNGEIINLDEGQVVVIRRDKMVETHIHPSGLITVYGFPAKVTVEPFYEE